MNNEELYHYIEESTNNPHNIINFVHNGFDQTIDLGEGFHAISQNGKWGAISFDNTIIAPILYDFVYLDEFEYAHFCLVCGHNGYFYKDNDMRIKYKGLYDIYVDDKLFLCNLEHYENLNHPISLIPDFKFLLSN